jgi:hypothetical protein
LWIAAAEPDEPARRFSRFTGRPIQREAEVATIALERGLLRFASSAFLQREFGVVPGPPLPYLAAYEIEVAGLDRIDHLLATAGLTARQIAGGLALSLPPSLGGTIIFRPPAG